MTRRSWRTRGLIGALIAATIAIPGAAHAAAPSLTSVQVFGNKRPADPGAADPLTGASTLYATSRPFGNMFDQGQLYVIGNAAGDVDGDGKLRLWVDIVVSDEFGRTVTRSVTVQPVNDPEINRAQGDFNAELPVTNLGVHKATGLPSSTDDAEWGKSILTVTVRARNASDGLLSSPAVRQITKYAGTPKDTFAPLLSRMTWPPEEWCHLAAPGLTDERTFDFFGSFGGTREGGCGNISLGAPLTAPDVTWVACLDRPIPGSSVSLNQLTNNGWANWQNNACVDQRNSTGPTGNARVSGVIDDILAPGAQGIGSEISDITIEVFQGTTLFKKFENQATFRLGTKSGWGISLNINDFAPNAFTGEPAYVVKVTVKDAWGNTATAQSPEIIVYPY